MTDKILIIGWGYKSPFIDLGEITFNSEEFVRNPGAFKLVVFTGGEDVDPRFYGETSPKGYCGFSTYRDMKEAEIFKIALDNNILMTGICRGVQFLNVMSGGKLMHHISNHAGTDHNVEMLSGNLLRVNSYHHQMVIPNKDAVVVGWAMHNLSDIYIGKDDKPLNYKGKENEIVIFTKTNSFGVQYHPEMLPTHHEAFEFYRNMIITALETNWETFIKIYTRRPTLWKTGQGGLL